MEQPYSGSATCARCTKLAYYWDAGQAVCGRHSKSDSRNKLRRDPNKLREKQQAENLHRATLVPVAGQPGQVRLHKFSRLFAYEIPRIPSFTAVLPNYRSGKMRKDAALGMPELSPMTIGPVYHGQPGLPAASCIENFHQGSKKFSGQTMDEFYDMQLELFQSPTPTRHNPYSKTNTAGNRNIPEFFVWKDKTGTEHHLSYLESRQFYCNFLARAVAQTSAYERLCRMLDNGYNLVICGHDAAPFADGQSDDDAYCDPSTPFGHERVLYVMLKTREEALWPWVRRKTFEF